MRSRVMLVSAAAVAVLAVVTPADAIHWYRNTDSGCAPNDGALTDDPLDEFGDVVHGPLAATVQVLHNAYKDEATGTSLLGFELQESVVTVQAGESILWTWNSSHCHSVTFGADYGGSAPDSGFFYPTTPPESPRVLPGLFEYPLLDPTPTLSWQHTFTTPGTFSYICVHHASIGMVGTIVVV